MSVQFGNPIMAGPNLARPVMQSPNFNLATKTGWAIYQNGSAFFFGITTSGSFVGTDFVINTAGGFFYNGTPAANNLVLSFVPGTVTVTDSFGNVALPGYTQYTDTGTKFIACNVSSNYLVAPGFAGMQWFASSAHTQSAGYGSGSLGGVILAQNPSGGGSLSLIANGTDAALDLQSQGNANSWNFLSPITLTNALNFVGTLGLNGPFYLTNQSSTPASVAGETLLYSDAFTQLHTDRAIVTQVDVEPANQGSPPGAGGSGAKLYSTGGHAQSRSGQAGISGDSNSYDLERLTIPLGTALTVNQTTFSQTVFSHAVGIGTYRVKVRGTYTENQAAGIPEFAFTGPATSGTPLFSATFAGNGAAGAGGATNIRGAQRAAIGTANFVNGITMTGASYTFDMELMVTFSAAGTLAFVAASTVAADTFTIAVGTEMTIQPVVAT